MSTRVKAPVNLQIELWRKLGCTVLPVPRGQKGPPALDSWKKYMVQQPTEAEYKYWFPHDYNGNFAVLCGQISGDLVVLDWDDMKFYNKIFDAEKLEKECPVAETGSGKRHIYVRSPRTIKSFAIREIGLEVRSEGQYVLGPPSIHPNGKPYRFVNHVREIPVIPDIEEALRRRVDALGIKLKPRYTAHLEGPTEFVEEIQTVIDQMPRDVLRDWNEGRPKGERSTAWFNVVLWFAKNSVPEKQIVPLLKDWDRKTGMNKLAGRDADAYIHLTYVNALSRIPSLSQVYEVYDRWIYCEDNHKTLHICLATAILYKDRTVPIWLYLIGPSGDVKTTLLEAFLDGNNETYHLQHITRNALASGWAQKTKGDLAPKLNNKLVVTTDMAQFLQLHPNEKGAIWAQLRNAFDGYVVRDTGSGVNTRYTDLKWNWLVGATPKIDRELLIHQELGTRELVWRMPKIENIGNLQEKVWNNINKKDAMRKELNEIVRAFLDYKAEIPLQKKAIPKNIKNKLFQYANFISQLRATAEKDRSTGELTNFVYPEKPTRIQEQLKTIYYGLKNLDISITDDKAIEIIDRLAQSSIIPLRLRIIKELNKQSLSTTRLAKKLGINYRTLIGELMVLWHLKMVGYEETAEETEEKTRYKKEWYLKNDNPTVRFITGEMKIEGYL